MAFHRNALLKFYVMPSTHGKIHSSSSKVGLERLNLPDCLNRLLFFFSSLYSGDPALLCLRRGRLLLVVGVVLVLLREEDALVHHGVDLEAHHQGAVAGLT